MKHYEVGGDEAPDCFKSRGEAIRQAKRAEKAGYPCYVDMVETPPLTQALLLDAISGRAYATHRTRVWTAKDHP